MKYTGSKQERSSEAADAEYLDGHDGAFYIHRSKPESDMSPTVGHFDRLVCLPADPIRVSPLNIVDFPYRMTL